MLRWRLQRGRGLAERGEAGQQRLWLCRLRLRPHAAFAAGPRQLFSRCASPMRARHRAGTRARGSTGTSGSPSRGRSVSRLGASRYRPRRYRARPPKCWSISRWKIIGRRLLDRGRWPSSATRRAQGRPGPRQAHSSCSRKAAGSAAIQLAKPRLWSPDRPDLYTAEVSIIAGGRVTDSCSARFGVRSIAVSAQTGLTINGQPVKLKGGLHPCRSWHIGRGRDRSCRTTQG